jgi:hypothetical protein
MSSTGPSSRRSVACYLGLKSPRPDQTQTVTSSRSGIAAATPYYKGAVTKWPEKRVVALYLAPTDSLGADEVEEVEQEIKSRQALPAGRDWVRAITWDDVKAIIDGLPGRGGWLASTGIDAVEKARGDHKPRFDHAAAPLFSWMSPPSRSRRRTLRGLARIGSPAAARGEARPRARWGRPRL